MADDLDFGDLLSELIGATPAVHAEMAMPSDSSPPSAAAKPATVMSRPAAPPPKAAVPKAVAPKGAAPKGAAPKGAAPKGAAPKGAAPKGAAPKALPKLAAPLKPAPRAADDVPRVKAAPPKTVMPPASATGKPAPEAPVAEPGRTPGATDSLQARKAAVLRAFALHAPPGAIPLTQPIITSRTALETLCAAGAAPEVAECCAVGAAASAVAAHPGPMPSREPARGLAALAEAAAGNGLLHELRGWLDALPPAAQRAALAQARTWHSLAKAASAARATDA